MKILESKYLGLRLKNPIIVGSCGLTNSVESIKKLAENGAAAVVVKSVFEEEIIQEHQDVLKNKLGDQDNNLEFLDYFDYQIKSDVLKKTAALIQDAKKEVDIPIIGSINCASSGEWVSYAKILADAGADALELNLFKLPSDVNQKADEQEQFYQSIVSAVKSHVSIPVSVKIAPYSSNLAASIKKMDDIGVDGITMFNRFYNVDFDIYTDEVIAGSPYSTNEEYYNALRWISIMSGKVNTDLSASTGVHNAETAIKMLMAGATTVQIVSKIYMDGPEVISSILEGIKEWMEKRGYVSIDEFRGSVHHDPDQNSERFERVQFMRYFGEHMIS
ncbi:dihydroorotate dehydrogenase-like protein [Saccharicrinis aurantiacus]|uniref:dihydroorotate dehydrogenase-like protein n=1 Tax=Saccharicrinis aurantiacus TaxID=1849719 RepID=UPI002493509F|nr:dihydroorotate dehydrogenase-like protein [Saccharicrinis aurantiacus]